VAVDAVALLTRSTIGGAEQFVHAVTMEDAQRGIVACGLNMHVGHSKPKETPAGWPKASAGQESD